MIDPAENERKHTTQRRTIQRKTGTARGGERND